MVIFEKLHQALIDQLPVYVLTLVEWQEDETYLGQIALVHPNGEITGEIIDQKCTNLLTEYIFSSAESKPHLFPFQYTGKQGIVFCEPIRRQRKAVIFGAGHISRPLCELLTKLRYNVTIFDDRPDFANKIHFPDAEKVVCNSFSRALSELTIDAETAIIIVTRGHQYDLQCLRAVINLEFGYLGMIGSRRRVAAVKHLMKEDGFESDKLVKLFAPIGLDIGAQTPMEIAMSIAAEVMAVMNHRSAQSLTLRTGVR